MTRWIALSIRARRLPRQARGPAVGSRNPRRPARRGRSRCPSGRKRRRPGNWPCARVDDKDQGIAVKSPCAGLWPPATLFRRRSGSPGALARGRRQGARGGDPVLVPRDLPVRAAGGHRRSRRGRVVPVCACPTRLTTWRRARARPFPDQAPRAARVASFLGTLPTYVDPVVPPFLVSGRRGPRADSRSSTRRPPRSPERLEISATGATLRPARARRRPAPRPRAGQRASTTPR